MFVSDSCRNFVDKCRSHEKAKKNILPKNTEESLRLEDAAVFYGLSKSAALKDFTYNDFKKLADRAPFTQAEWAEILHVSERTLQRYAKNNHAFASINAERFMLIENVLKQAGITFGSLDKFYNWLKRNPYKLEANLSMQSLSSFDGIQQVLTQMGRIQHGIFS